MVEELAKWKTALTRALNDLREATQILLEERRKIHTQSMKMYCYLKGIVEKTTHERTAITLKYRNIIEVTAANQEIVAKLKQKFDVIDDVIYENYKENKTIQSTLAEKNVEKVRQYNTNIDLILPNQHIFLFLYYKKICRYMEIKKIMGRPEANFFVYFNFLLVILIFLNGNINNFFLVGKYSS